MTSSGDNTQLFTNLSAFENLLAGIGQTYSASFNTSQIGNFFSNLIFNLSDDTAILGATGGQQLVLTLQGSVILLFQSQLRY